MDEIEFKTVLLLVDKQKTLAAYAAYEGYGCSCEFCEDYVPYLKSNLPLELLDFFAEVGIDFEKPVDIEDSTPGGYYEFYGALDLEQKGLESVHYYFNSKKIKLNSGLSIQFSTNRESVSIFDGTEDVVVCLHFWKE